MNKLYVIEGWIKRHYSHKISSMTFLFLYENQ